MPRKFLVWHLVPRRAVDDDFAAADHAILRAQPVRSMPTTIRTVPTAVENAVALAARAGSEIVVSHWGSPVRRACARSFP